MPRVLSVGDLVRLLVTTIKAGHAAHSRWRSAPRYSEMMTKMVKRHEAWRLEYRANRYMRDLDLEDVLVRAGDFLTNSLTHSSDGRLAMKPVDLEGDSSGIQRFTHVLEELVLRDAKYRDPRIIEAMKPPKPKSPKVMRALQVVAGRKWPENILVKFGKRKYMGELLQHGRGCVSPATSYSDKSLGYARADDELSISAFLDPKDAHHFFGVGQEGKGSVAFTPKVPYLGSWPLQLRANTDFYVYCLAASVDARLFDDFDADTCLVVTDPKQFEVRLQSALSAQLGGWKFVAGPAFYFDPFFCEPHKMIPHFFKHFKYGYQKEHRLAWLPPMPEEQWAHAKLDHIPFEIGPLTDCARLIWL